MTTAYVTWSTVKRLLLGEKSKIEPECADAIRAVIPDDSARQAEVGFPLAANLLDIYRYRYQSIEEFRVSRHGWPGFFSALEAYRREPRCCACLPVQAAVFLIMS